MQQKSEHHNNEIKNNVNIKNMRNQKNYIGNFSVLISIILTICALNFSNFFDLFTFSALAILFLGKLFNPKNDILTVFLVLYILFFIIPIYSCKSACNKMPG